MVLGETVKQSDWRSVMKTAPTLTLTRLCHGITAKSDATDMVLIQLKIILTPSLTLSLTENIPF